MSNCIYCERKILGFATKCNYCSREACEGDCTIQHWIECARHHEGYCKHDCRFCRSGEVTNLTAVGG